MSELSERILQLIKEHGISYGELSQQTGIPKSILQRYATGVIAKIPIDRLERIAIALDTTVQFLMGWVTEPTHHEPALDDFQFAILSDTKDLSPSQKEEVLRFARMLKAYDDKSKHN